MSSIIRIDDLPEQDIELFMAALKARKYAHAPYSDFQVGSALRTTTGQIYTGCNVENAAYGSTMCAERVAMFKTVSTEMPLPHIEAILIVADYPGPLPPCGACRQVMSELASDARVIMTNTDGQVSEVPFIRLLPSVFTLEK